MVELFPAHCFDCTTVGEERLTGRDDAKLMEVCSAGDWILNTLDSGSGNIPAPGVRWMLAHAGISGCSGW